MIEHISGETNCIADWLSRGTEAPDMDKEIDQIAIPVYAVRRDVYAPRVPTTMELKEAYETMTSEEKSQAWLSEEGYYVSRIGRKLFIPKVMQEGMMWWFHCSQYGGHCGINRTLRRMRRWVYWKGMASDVREYVNQCLVCIRKAPLSLNHDWRGILSRLL